MPKISWNDLQDSDSSASSDCQPAQQPVAIIKKMSAPPSTSNSRLKQACDNMSLTKIQNHEKKQVWLYIPNSFGDNVQDIDRALRSKKQLIKIKKMNNVGWNVLVSKQTAIELIVNGANHQGKNIRFIYSNRNQESRQQKLQKKVSYVQKSNKEEYSSKQKPTLVKNISFYDLREIESQQYDLSDKKKVKYVQKDSNNQVEIKPSFHSMTQLKSPPKSIKNNYQTKTPGRRYMPKNSDFSPAQQDNIKQQILEKDTKNKYQPSNKQKKQMTSDFIKQQDQTVINRKCSIEQNQKVQQKNTAQRQIKMQDEGNSSSSQSLQQLMKKRKKKNKKNKTKIRGQNSTGSDNNNPFSSLIN